MVEFPTLEQFEFHHRLAEVAGVSLVFFSSRQCGSCRRFKMVLSFYLEQFGGLNVFLVDAERDLALTREFDVYHLPAIFLYIDGKYHRQLQVAATVDSLRQALTEALDSPAEEAP
jgi:thioredoxin 1